MKTITVQAWVQLEIPDELEPYEFEICNKRFPTIKIQFRENGPELEKVQLKMDLPPVAGGAITFTIYKLKIKEIQGEMIPTIIDGEERIYKKS